MANAEAGVAPAQPAAQTYTAEQLEQARQQARTEGAAQAAREAVAADRARTAAIMASDEAQGRTELAQHLANTTDMTAEDVRAALAKAPKAAPAAPANPLAAAMGNVANPKVGAGPSDEDGDDETKAANSIIAHLPRRAKK